MNDIRSCLDNMTPQSASKDAITIVSISNNAYSVFTAVMLKSLLMHHLDSERIELYLLSLDVTASNKKKLTEAIRSDKLRIHWVDIDTKLLQELGILEVYAKRSVCYYKVLIPYVVSSDVTKAIYLDSDIIVRDDISKLWHTDMAHAPLAAIRDSRIRNAREGIRNWEKLGICPDVGYFNAGVLVVNLAYWRQHDIRKMVLACVEKNMPYLWQEEQYVFNVLFSGQWKELDGRWNQFPEIQGQQPFLFHFSGHDAKALGGTIPGLFFRYAAFTRWGRWGSVKDEVMRRALIRHIKVCMVKLLKLLRLRK
ncbi:MAG: glycosyltransferase family 8 protein [Candidatus Omnitrophota bacterium]